MNNRQAGRRRGRGGQRQGGNPGRPDNGNRIDNRARGNAAQLLEKYKNLAQDAQRSGDRVSTEYYLQFADHYFRVLAESRARMEDGNQPRRNRDDEDDAEGVEDFGFEGDLGSPAFYQQPQQQRDDSRDREDRPRQRDDQSRQQRDDQQRDARPRRDRETSSEDRPRRDREPGNDGGDAGEQRPRREARTYTRDSGVRDSAPRDSGRDAGTRDSSDEPRTEALVERPVAANDEPRRRGRPRREVAVADNDGFDATLLPPAISTEAAPAADDAAPERPRRGRPRKVRVEDEAVPPAA